ncbi:MAG: hypothetical protein Q8M07_08045 [Prosthecobacter sp.]|nr:hypothetical protein [Prosthecobacter sp.]
MLEMMKMTWTIVARLLIWILPVLMFDGCLNRDPHLKVDEHFTIGASWPGAPMYLGYLNRSAVWDEESAKEMSEDEWMRAFDKHGRKQSWQLSGITDYRLSNAAIIGQSPKGWFIADRRFGELRLFESSAQRDEGLRNFYHLDDLTSFAAPSARMWLMSNWLWPWVHLYYAVCLILVPSLTIWGYRRRQKQLLDIRTRKCS